MLKPTMRDKKRYIALEKTSIRVLLREYQKWFGLKESALLNLKKIETMKNIDIYRINHKYTERMRVVCMMLNKRIYRVGGTIKSLRKKLKEDGYVD